MPPNRGSPGIACIGLVGRKNEPLHIATFSVSPSNPPRTELDYHMQLFASLDIFETRNPDTPDGHYNLLFAKDPRLAFYGYISPTNIKYIIGVDMEGKAPPEQAALEGGTGKSQDQYTNGIREKDLFPAFWALRRAYARLMRDPFYETEEGDDDEDRFEGKIKGNGKIRSQWFHAEVRRIGESWYSGIPSL